MKRYLVPAMIVVALIAVLVATSTARKEAEKKSWLGVYTQAVDYDVAAANDLDIRYGALISMVIEDSPAEIAGLREDDVIIAFNNEKVTDSDDLVDLLIETKPGDNVNLTIIRDGKEQTVPVQVGETPDREFVLKKIGGDNNVMIFPKVSRAYVGVYLDNLTEQLGQYFGVPEGKGALITEVDKDSPAQKAGMKAGDVIVQIDGEKILGANDVTDFLSDRKEGEKVNFTVVRNQRSSQILVELAEREHSAFDNGFMLGPDHAYISVPQLRGYYKADIPDLAELETELGPEFEQEMRQLAEEMAKLKIELKDKSKFDIDREELRSDLEELRRELREMKRELENELRELNERIQ